MFKAVLCDDNEIILEGLKMEIDWSAFGIRLVGTASDGEAALRLVESEEPDILITDIRMPFRDGLELIKEAQARNAGIAAVIISGYDDFEYARTAVRLGVADYLLKPIDPAELGRILAKVVRGCEKSRRGRKAKTEEALRALLHREIAPEELERAYPEVQLSREGTCCAVRVRLDEKGLQPFSEVVQYEVERRFSKFVERFRGEKTWLVEKNGADCTFFLFTPAQVETQELRDRLIAEARRSIFSEDAKSDITIAVGDMHEGLFGGMDSLVECGQAMELRFIKGVNSTIFYEDAELYRRATGGNTGEEAPLDGDIIAAVKVQDRDALAKHLEQFCKWLRAKGGESYLYMTLAVGNLYSRILWELGESGVDVGEIFEDPMAAFKRVTAVGTLDAAIESLHQCLLEICDYLEKHRSRYSKVIETAMRYIHTQYTKPGLSIEDVAAAVYLSPGHFSTIFKNETGCTFTDYLIRVRMEKAKTLLASNAEKVYEISTKVGYESAAYFSSAFKKYTGLSPSEYKARVPGGK